MPYAPGTNIGPNLRLLRLLAQGGMGSVWVAEHLGLMTQVAVKFMSEEMAADESAVLRFSREAAAAAKIKSPHVVQIFDHGLLDERVPYIVMELLDGSSLGNVLRECSVIDTKVTAAILAQIGRVLEKAHAIGIVHRDIKPDNIFLTDSGGEIFVKVLDFGVAKQVVESVPGVTSTGVAIGTPSFMSPEQIVGAKDVTLATDLWALGVMAFQCLTGQLPFQATTYGGLCIEISRGRFPAASSVRPELPSALDGWFAKALELEPAKRFGSARELAIEFQVAAGFSAESNVTASSNALRLGAGRKGDALRTTDAHGQEPTPRASLAERKRLAESTVGVEPPLVWPETPPTMQSGPPVAGPSRPSIQGASLSHHPETTIEAEAPRRRPWLLWGGAVMVAIVASVFLRNTYWQSSPAAIDKNAANSNLAAAVPPPLVIAPAPPTASALAAPAPSASVAQPPNDTHVEQPALAPGHGVATPSATPPASTKSAMPSKPVAPLRAPPKRDLLAP